MKKAPYIILLCTILFACKKPDIPQNTNSSGYFFCKIDGNGFVPPKTSAVIGSDSTLVISGTNSINKLINVTLKGINTDTFIIDNKINKGLYAQGFSSYQNANSGIVIISKLDTTNKKISGTFSFEIQAGNGLPAHSITEGTFTDLTLE